MTIEKNKKVICVLIIVFPAISATALIAAEIMSDWELANLYGGCLGFYNPYCTSSQARDCPGQTECKDELQGCRFCIPLTGLRCKDDWTEVPDEDGCQTTNTPCVNANLWPDPSKGFCSENKCVPD